MKNYISVDRIEGEFAVCIDDEHNAVDILLENIIGDVKEGDIIFFDDGVYKIDEEVTKKRREEIAKLFNGLK